MIGCLRGTVRQLEPGLLIVDVGGVGYRVATSLRAAQQLPEGEAATVWVHTLVRDDGIFLYGFHDRVELVAFERLIAVAGIGPRIALAVLSALSPDELAEAVEAADLSRLVRTPGVGRKTAERILLELRGRLRASGAAPTGDIRGDAVSALVNLGYAPRDAQRAVASALAAASDADLGEVLRLALQHLTR